MALSISLALSFFYYNTSVCVLVFKKQLFSPKGNFLFGGIFLASKLLSEIIYNPPRNVSTQRFTR